jgi:hypothetical protein
MRGFWDCGSALLPPPFPILCPVFWGMLKATSNSARPFPRAGEIAIFANFTKSTGSSPPFFFCLFNLLRMVRLLHLQLLRERRYLPSRKRRLNLGSRISERCDRHAH